MSITQLTDGELNYFEKLVHLQIELYSGMLEQIKTELKSANSSQGDSAYSLHIGDAASVTIERERLFTQMQQHSEKLALLEKALERIKTKTYGICQKTGKRISRERLEAIPYTNVCLEAAM